jgi:methionyl-tRNA formyltransferase
MVLRGIGVLASDTARTKAYIQAMVAEDMLPEICIVYSDNSKLMEKEANKYEKPSTQKRYFDLNEPIIYTLDRAGIPYLIIESKDINSEQMQSAIADCNAEYLVYSGYGGYILKPNLFQLGKKFIHVHAGILPKYRGSTTVYYSYLQEGKIGATAIFLNERIDEGEIIVQKEYGLPSEKVDIDYIYEPYIRSKVLMEALKIYSESGTLTGRTQGQDGAETYFIIHPLLKHIALLEMENLQKAGKI